MKKLFTIILMIAGICFVANAKKYKLDNEFFHNKTTWNSTNPQLPLVLKVTEDSNGNINIKAQYILYFFTGDTWRDENDDLRFNLKANIKGKEIVYTGKLYSDDPNAVVAIGTFGGIDAPTVYNLDKK